jgi:hypothetical protein
MTTVTHADGVVTVENDGRRSAYRSAANLGNILRVDITNNIVIIIREFGIERLLLTLEPNRVSFKTLVTLPRRIIDVRQAKYLIKRSAILNGIRTFKR